MIITLDTITIDLAFVVIASFINLALIGIFLHRPFGLSWLEYILGLSLSATVLPLLAPVILNHRSRRDWWSFVLPPTMAALLMPDFILEYVLGGNWRGTWMRGLMLLFYYPVLMLMTGYAFLTRAI